MNVLISDKHGIRLDASDGCLILGDKNSGKSYLLHKMVEDISKSEEENIVYVLGSNYDNQNIYSKFDNVFTMYADNDYKDFRDTLSFLLHELDSRLSLFQEVGVTNFEELHERQVTLATVYLVVDGLCGMDMFLDNDSRYGLIKLIQYAKRVGFVCIFSASFISGRYMESLMKDMKAIVVKRLADEQTVSRIKPVINPAYLEDLEVSGLVYKGVGLTNWEYIKE